MWARVGQELGAKKSLGWRNTVVRALSLLWHARQHFEVVAAISGPHTRALRERYGRVVYRYTLPYLATPFTRAERRQMLMGHYRYLNHALQASFFEDVLGESMRLWSCEISGRQFSIHVGGPCLHREGDLTLVFRMDGRPLYRIAFSVIDASLLKIAPAEAAALSRHVMYIGQVQGHADCFAQIRQATHLCRDVAPADLLMSGVFGMAKALDINAVVGVTAEHSLSYKHLIDMDTVGSYTEFWRKFHGVRDEGGHHVLDLPLAEKPIGQIKSNHRGRTLAKRQLKKAIAESAESAVRPRRL